MKNETTWENLKSLLRMHMGKGSSKNTDIKIPKNLRELYEAS